RCPEACGQLAVWSVLPENTATPPRCPRSKASSELRCPQDPWEFRLEIQIGWCFARFTARIRDFTNTLAYAVSGVYQLDKTNGHRAISSAIHSHNDKCCIPAMRASRIR